MTRRLTTFLLAALGSAAAAGAQPLTLPEAIARARSQNVDVRASAVAEREADQRVAEARARYQPTVDFTESWQRGNQPVFVFSSLLAQRRFTAADFALDALNRPAATDNFRSAFLVEQSLFDATTSARVRSAGLGRDLAAAGGSLIHQSLAVEVTDAYGRVLVGAATRRSAAAGIEAAEADRQIAGNRREAGMVTDADVLQLDVHLARMRQRDIQAAADERIARAELNQLMGVPLDTSFTLDAVASPADLVHQVQQGVDATAVARRPEVKIAVLQQQLAEAAEREARAAFLPHVSAQGGWEQNGGAWDSRASSWVVGAVARVNLFRGFADRARLAEAREQVASRALARERAETAARLDLETAAARLDAARAREALGRAALTQALESRRIIRDRYEGGLADVTALLRAEEAVQEAESQQTAARADALVSVASLQRALGQP